MDYQASIQNIEATTDRVDLYSQGIEDELYDMDREEFRRNRFALLVLGFHGGQTEDLLGLCVINFMAELIFNDKHQNITDDQIEAMKRMMSHLLSLSNANSSTLRLICVDMLMYVSIVLLSSNKKHDCEAWIREHMSELTSLRTIAGESILHLAVLGILVVFPKAPLVKLLVEDGNMDVNVQNQSRQTPLHWLYCSNLRVLFDNKTTPVEDRRRVAELLIYNGAHMDAVDVRGTKASHLLSPREFPQFSFNVNLQCLAATAIVKHGIRYQGILPACMTPLVQSHKSGQL